MTYLRLRTSWMVMKSTAARSKCRSAKETSQDKQLQGDILAKKDNHLLDINTNTGADLILGPQTTHTTNAKSITKENKNIAKEERGKGHDLEILETEADSGRGRGLGKRVGSITEENAAIQMTANDEETDSEE